MADNVNVVKPNQLNSDNARSNKSSSWRRIKNQKTSPAQKTTSGSAPKPIAPAKQKTKITINPTVKEQIEGILEDFPTFPTNTKKTINDLRQQHQVVLMMSTLATACSLVALKAASDPRFAVQSQLASRFRDVMNRAAQFAVSDPRILQVAMQRVNTPVPTVEQIAFSLDKKATESDIPIEMLTEIFARGCEAYDPETQKIDMIEYAFNRVNSFIAGGSATDIDQDLLNELSPDVKNRYARVAHDDYQLMVNYNKNTLRPPKTKAFYQRKEKNRRQGLIRALTVKEDNLDELSQDLKDRYVQKAAPDYGLYQKLRKKTIRSSGIKAYYKRKSDNRSQGITRALGTNEDQLDELSQKTRENYIRKAMATRHIKDRTANVYKAVDKNEAERRRKKLTEAKPWKRKGRKVVTPSTSQRDAYAATSLVKKSPGNDPKEKADLKWLAQREKRNRNTERTMLVVRKGEQNVKRVPVSRWKHIKATHHMAEENNE